MTDLARQCWGSGQRSAWMLHGSTSSRRTWWRIGPRVALNGWTVIAWDLPNHGDSPPAADPLTPLIAAAALADRFRDEPPDLLVGHSFGAAVALTLAALDPGPGPLLVLEELPGPNSVDWPAEADAVRTGSVAARTDADAVEREIRAAQPLWHSLDCHHAVQDLARCDAGGVAAGLAIGTEWLVGVDASRFTGDALVLLAPDAAGRNHLEDATASRGADREQLRQALRADVRIFEAGHCIHRDRSVEWIDAVAGWLADRDRAQGTSASAGR